MGGGYDEKIDLWALGITIFKLIAGYTPFESEYHSETVTNILKGEFKFSYSRWSKYSPHAKSFVSQLLKRVNERMTLSEAKSHLWLHDTEEVIHSPRRLRKRSSHCILMNQDFHEEFKNKVSNANAKEEGSVLGESRMFKKINTLKSKNFDLEDSDDEETVISSDVNSKFRNTFSTFSETSFFSLLEKGFVK